MLVHVGMSATVYVVLLLISCAFAQYPYPYHLYNHGVPYRYKQGLHHRQHSCHGQTQTCPEGYEFNEEYCGCFRDGDLPTVEPTATPTAVPGPGVLPILPLIPGIPGIPGILPFPPVPIIRCPPIPCPVGQVFDENRCRCVCTNQISQCPGRTTYNPRTCRCECLNRPVCNQFQQLNNRLCTCINVLPLPLPPPTRCPPLQCSLFQRFNPLACRCECAPRRCPIPKILDPSSCQCVCRPGSFARCNSINQRFNSDTCRCECTRVQVTVEVQVPGTLIPGLLRPGPLLPGPLIPGPAQQPVFPQFFGARTGTPGSKRKRHAFERRKARAQRDEVEGPQGNFRIYRRKRSRSPGPGTGGFLFPPQLPPQLVRGPPVRGPPVRGPPVQGPPRTVTERRVVPAPCPGGTFLQSSTCTCI